MPARDFSAIATVIQQAIQCRVDVWDVISLKIVIDIDLPIAVDVVADAMVPTVCLKGMLRAQTRIDAVDPVGE